MERTGARAVAIGIAVAVGIGLTAGCGPRDASPVERGRMVFMGRCIQCHNPNPVLDGTLGPALAGSPRALIEARVLRAEYPAGYAPKRTTKAMPPFPDLAPEIDDLAAYLGSLAPASGR